MTEYVWTSPGGIYTVPDSWRAAFLAEFPDYRIRWSLRDHCWHLEQKCGSNTLAPYRIDPFDDSLIRAADGYWLVMAIQPGNRMPCPAVTVRFPRQTCGWTLPVATRETSESICPVCRSKRRDGRVMAGYWPNRDEVLQLAASCLSQDEEAPAAIDMAARHDDNDEPEPSAGDGW